MNQYQDSFNLLKKEIKETFPFGISDYKKFQSLIDDYDKKVIKINNQKDFFPLLNKYLKSLDNSHTRLGNYPGKKFYKPVDYSVKIYKNNFYLFKGQDLIGEIAKIDDERTQRLLDRIKKEIVGTTNQYLTTTGLLWLLTSKDKSPVKVLMKSGQELDLVREVIKPEQATNIELSKVKRIPIIKIRSFSYDQNTVDRIDHFISDNYHPETGLVIDLRGNMGGNSANAERITQRFINKKIKVGHVILRKDNVNPTNTFKKTRYLEPQGNYLEPNIVVIVDSFCFSSCEIFISGLKDNSLAKIIGEKTGGGSGNPKKVSIPIGDGYFEAYISTWKYYNNAGQPIEGRGIKPDIILIDNPLSNKDEALAKALSVLNQ